VSSHPTLDHHPSPAAEPGATGRHAEADRVGPIPHDLATRRAEAAFDQLNSEFGVPADQASRTGKQAVQAREAGLVLGTRTAVALSRENDPDPVVRVAGQDDRAADAARRAAVRARTGAARTGPER
jgi:hypothetical protein